MFVSFRKRAAVLGWVAFGVAALGLAGCGQAPQSTAPVKKAPSEASKQWAQVANGFIEDYFRAQPFFAAQAGRHEFDGQLPDFSAHGIKREISRLHDARQQISGVDPAPLEPRERFDREYLLSVIDKDLFWLEKAKYPSINPYWYINEIDPDLYLARNYAPLETRLKAYIRYAQGIPKVATDIQANLQGPLPKTFVEIGITDFGGLADFFSKSVAPVFASVTDPALQKQLDDADKNAAVSMNNLKGYLIGLRKTATDKFPLGKDLFSDMLKDTERVDVSVDEIEAAGKADLDRNLAAVKTECATYLPKGTLAACMAKMAANKTPGGVLDGARAQLAELKKFVQDNNVVSIPSNEEALVAEAPPYNRSNFAFIQIPGPFDHGVASVYNIAPPDPSWPKAEQAAYAPGSAVLLFTSAHEVWPGHFLQFLHSNANPTKLEGLWVGYAFAEGWAHYCEEMMYDRGLGKGDPEKHLGQLQEALLRDVRLLSAIGMHTGTLTVAQSEKMFKEQSFSDPGNSRQQSIRGTYDPAYLNYTLGKLMIKKLRNDWLAKTARGPSPGAAADDQSRWHEFHDEFLSYGGPPIPLLRTQLMGEKGAVL